LLEVIRHDIIIVGGGAAGLRAAIAAVEADPEASVAMVSKVYPMRSHTVSAEGGAAAVARRADDNLEMHGFDTVKGSDFLGDQDVIQYFVEEAPKELTLLEHWGCPWSRNEDGSVATRAFGGMSTKRTSRSASTCSTRCSSIRCASIASSATTSSSSRSSWSTAARCEASRPSTFATVR
jgi:succinate dehydrogenase/fumarate reductase flavoprotein subunit